MLLSISFFDRVLFPIYSNYQAQTYYGITLYLLLAMALSSVLAAIAYLLSLSSSQDSEKRSEYECGFEPFDSATRLPFDVHFYLVGILFLIFDVEIALLFPWVLSLRTSGWFGFYLMLGFIVLLAIGFLYEWKRGALIWPSRQQEQKYMPGLNAAGLLLLYPTEASNFIYMLSLFIYLLLKTGYINYSIVLLTPVKPKIALAKVPATAYVNIPLTRVTRTIKLAFMKLAMWIKRTGSTLNHWRLKRISSYIAAVQFIERRTRLHKNSLTFYVKQVANVASTARNKHFHDDITVTKFENKSLAHAAIATKEYQKLVKKYATLHQRLLTKQQNKKLSPKTRAVLSLITKYLELQRKDSMRVGSRHAHTTRRLNKQLATLLGHRRKKVFPRQRRASRLRGSRMHKALGSVAPIVLATPVDTYALQFIGNFLPEMLVTVAIAVVLTFLAIELGYGQPKKILALVSLDALCWSLYFTIAIYVCQLFFGASASLFNGYFVVTFYTVTLKLLTVISGLFILNSSRQYIMEHRRHLLEYPTVLMLALLFMLLLVGSGHLISAFITIVGFSLNLYVLVLFDTSFAIAREAGVKYFYLSAISTGLMLYAIFLIFVVLNSGHLYEIGHFLAMEPELVRAAEILLQLAIVMFLVGLFFKLSAFPGHLWAADVYEGSPDPVTAFFMLPVKISILAFVIQLVAVALEPIAPMWQPFMVVGATISLLWGCLAALAELKTKRFLAYASINQIGFLLMGLSTASLDGYRSTILYLFLYVIMNMGFLLVFLHARREDGRSLIYITDFRGFGQYHRPYSWSLAMVVLSMAGIPPLAGFFGKYYLLLHAQAQELSGLVIVGLATSLVSTYYYLRFIKIMWFEGRDGLGGVSYHATQLQKAGLRLLEFILFVFVIYSGLVSLALDYVVYKLVVFNDFYAAIPSSSDGDDLSLHS